MFKNIIIHKHPQEKNKHRRCQDRESQIIHKDPEESWSLRYVWFSTKTKLDTNCGWQHKSIMVSMFTRCWFHYVWRFWFKHTRVELLNKSNVVFFVWSVLTWLKRTNWTQIFQMLILCMWLREIKFYYSYNHNFTIRRSLEYMKIAYRSQLTQDPDETIKIVRLKIKQNLWDSESTITCPKQISWQRWTSNYGHLEWSSKRKFCVRIGVSMSAFLACENSLSSSKNHAMV